MAIKRILWGDLEIDGNIKINNKVISDEDLILSLRSGKYFRLNFDDVTKKIESSVATGNGGRYVENVGTVDGVDISELVPVMKIMHDETLATAVTDYTISGLDLDTAKVYRLIAVINNNITTSPNYFVYLNGDNIDTNYYSQQIQSGGATLASQRVNSPYIGSITTGAIGYIELTLKRLPTGNPLINATLLDGNGAYLAQYISGIQNTAITANITSITLHSSDASGIGANSAFTLLGGKS